MGIRFAGDYSLSCWSAAPIKACTTQIETTPEEMHRTALADESCAKFLEDKVGGQYYAPKAIGVLRIVGCMSLILMQWNRIGNFLRLGINIHLDTGAAQHSQRFT